MTDRVRDTGVEPGGDASGSLWESAYEGFWGGVAAVTGYRAENPPSVSPRAGSQEAVSDGSGIREGARAQDCRECSKEGLLAVDGFLKRHPELNLTAADREANKAGLAQAQGNISQLKTSYDTAKKQEKAWNELAKDQEKILADLKAAGVPDVENPERLKSHMDRLDQKTREGFEKRFAAFYARIGELDKEPYLDVHDIARQMQRQELAAYDKQVRLGLEDDLNSLSGLAPVERQEVLSSLDRILDPKDGSQVTRLTAAQRLTIARDLIHQIAHPEDIKQGYKNTCALASCEYVLAVDHPGIYARTVSELALEAEIRSFDRDYKAQGAGVKIDPLSIGADDGDSYRSLASKIFQTGAANLALEDDNARYVNFKPGAVPAAYGLGGRTPVDDTGERLIAQANGQETVSLWPGLYAKDQVEVLSRLTGDRYATEDLQVISPQQLLGDLEKKGRDYGYPIKIGFEYANHMGHAVSITKIDRSETPAMVTYEDTARPRGKSETMPIGELFDLAFTGRYMVVDGKKVPLISMHPSDNRVQIIFRAN